MKIRDYLILNSMIMLIFFWSIFGFIYWVLNPELTQMQIFLIMIGMG